MDPQIGECCFCKGECNPSSQACGLCMRKCPPVYMDELICEELSSRNLSISPVPEITSFSLSKKVVEKKKHILSVNVLRTPCNTPNISATYSNKIENKSCNTPDITESFADSNLSNQSNQNEQNQKDPEIKSK